MRKNKKLQNYANESMQHLRNDDIYNALLQEHRKLKEERQSKKPFYSLKQFKIACATCACIVVSLVVALCVVFIKPQEAPSVNDNSQNITNNSQQPDVNNPPLTDIPHYEEEDKNLTIVSNYNLTEALANTKITVLTDESYIITEAKDGRSGDILFYTIEINNEENMISCQIEIITNAYYEVKEESTNDAGIILGKEFNIKSTYEFYDEEGIYFHTVYAEAEVDGIKIIVREFSSITLSEDSGFQEFIESTFSFS